MELGIQREDMDFLKLIMKDFFVSISVCLTHRHWN